VTVEKLDKNAAEEENQGFQFGGTFCLSWHNYPSHYPP